MVAAKQLDVEFACCRCSQAPGSDPRGLVEPAIALETDAQGHANWDFGDARHCERLATRAPAQPAAFGVGNVAITRGMLTYRDGKSGAETKVAIDSLKLSARDAQSPVNAEFSGKFDDVAVAMTGQLGPLESLVQRRWPYTFALAGEIDGQKTKSTRDCASRAKRCMSKNSTPRSATTRSGARSRWRPAARSRYTVDLTAPVLSLAHCGGELSRTPMRQRARRRGSRRRLNYLFPKRPCRSRSCAPSTPRAKQNRPTDCLAASGSSPPSKSASRCMTAISMCHS